MYDIINRTIYKEIIETIKNKAVTVITGARQVGKTTPFFICQHNF